ncbi:Alb1-domain-containing protein [Halenospora varia]|nr:Alb1-domain-containing protein [Halenospora varia]
MAKTAPNKSKRASTSIHSRAAKRASSPSIDTDKSLKDVKPPTDSKSTRPSVLAVHQGAGVSKKSKNGRKSVLSAKARRRQEKGADRAEAFMDKTETKVEKSKARGRTVQERSKAWEELNKKMLAQKAKEEAERIEKENWVDEEDDGMEEDTEVKDAEVVAQDVPRPEPAEEEEEIL